MFNPATLTKITTAAVLSLTLLVSIPLTASQDQLPLGRDDVGELERELLDAMDLTVGGLDPTGMAPTARSLRANSVMTALANQLDEYKGLLYSGALPAYDLAEFPDDEIAIQQSPVPTRVFYHTNLLDLVEDPPINPCQTTSSRASSSDSSGGKVNVQVEGGGDTNPPEPPSPPDCNDSTQSTSTPMPASLPAPRDVLPDIRVPRTGSNPMPGMMADYIPFEDWNRTYHQTTNLTPELPTASPDLQEVGTQIVFQDDFDDGTISSSKWPSRSGVSESTNCGSVSGSRALYFYGTSGRYARTPGLNVQNGDSISFYARHGTGTGGGTCDKPEPEHDDDLVLEYSTNGGSSWTAIKTLQAGSHGSWGSQSAAIPSVAKTSNTMFRWRELNFAAYTDRDHWAVDDVVITNTVTNGGSGVTRLSDNFNDGSFDTNKWTYSGASEGSSCGSQSSPYALYFDGGSTRSAATKSLDVSSGGHVNFYLRIGTGSSPCENADSSEDVVLEYSTNGGGSWATIKTYKEDSYSLFTSITETIPVGAQTTSTQFRWRQLTHSGSSYDHWAIDDVLITETDDTGGGGSTGQGISEGFNSASTSWSTTGMWHLSSDKYQSCCKSSWYGQESTNNYDNGARNSGTLTSPIFTVPGSATLSFRSWHQTESGTSYDRKWVQVVSSTGAVLQDFPLIDGSQEQWVTRTYSLSSFTGQDVRLAFRFDTIDSIANGFLGWFVDDVSVTGTTSSQPPSPNDSTTVYTTEWNYNTVQANTYKGYYNDDFSAETSAEVNSGNDEFIKTLDIRDLSYGGGYDAWMGIWGRSTGCSEGGEYSISLEVNGVMIYMINPCAWSSTEEQYRYISFPPEYLVEGDNTFRFVGTSFAPGLRFGVDLDSGSANSVIRENGGSDRAGELIVEVALYSGQEDYEVMSRFTTTRRTDANGINHDSHGYDAYAFFDHAYKDTLKVLWKEDETGNRFHYWSNLQLLKNEYYSSSNRVSGWDHYEYDHDQRFSSNRGQITPINGQYYTWFIQQYETRNGGNPATDGDRFMNLVPSNPYSSVDRDRVQNPPPSGRAPNDGNGFALNAYWEAYYKSCEWINYGHSGESSHPHDCIGFRHHVLDMDEDFANFAEVTQKADGWVKAIIKTLESKNIEKWLLTMMKIHFVGDIVGYYWNLAQTGDEIHYALEERDFNPNFLRVPYTAVIQQPPIVNWALPVDLFFVDHLVSPTPSQEYVWRHDEVIYD